MTIAILGGTGKEGKGLARCWSRAGRDVVLGSRSEERGRQAASELNAELGTERVRGTSNLDAARQATLVVSTLPDKSHLEILSEVSDALDGKILISATIAWPPGRMNEPAAVERVQERLGSGVRVVAAFQTVSAHTLSALESPHEEDVIICADDAEAAAEAKTAIDETGLRGVVAGELADTRALEAMTGLLLKVNRRHGVKSTGIRITGLKDD